MKRTLVLLILLTLTASTLDAGWFSRDKEKEKAPEVTEREQRIQVEERLKAAQLRITTQEQRIKGQQQALNRLQWTNTLAIAGAIVLLIVGIGMGSSTAKRDERKP